MAITTIRSAYALDVETTQVLERIAHRWKVSKSEALRRAIRAAEGQKAPATDDALTGPRSAPAGVAADPGEGEGLGQAGSYGAQAVIRAQ